MGGCQGAGLGTCSEWVRRLRVISRGGICYKTRDLGANEAHGCLTFPWARKLRVARVREGNKRMRELLQTTNIKSFNGF